MKTFSLLIVLFMLGNSALFSQESYYIFYNGGVPEGIYTWTWGFVEEPATIEDIGFVPGTSGFQVKWTKTENTGGWISYGAFFGITGDVGFDIGDPVPDSVYFKLRAPDGVSESDTLNVWLYDPRYNDWNNAAYHRLENLQVLNDDEWHQFSISLFDFELYLNELNESNIVAVSFERPWHDEEETSLVLYIDQVWIGLPPFVSVEEERADLVNHYNLGNNYPNPFNASTAITYTIARRSDVMLTVYDLLGRKVTTVVDQFQSPGTYTVYFNAAELPSGVYYYQLVTKRFSQIKKMLLVN
jgi:hypothetical protein